jgi:hypothetical protein
MANHDMTTTAKRALETFTPKLELTPTKLMKIVVDLADLAIVKGSAAAGTDTFDIINIPAGTIVKSVAIRTLVPVDGGSVSSPTIALGDEDAASFQAACAVDAAANTMVFGSGAYLQAATVPYAVLGGKFYSAAKHIRMTLGGTWTGATAGRFQVLVEVVEIGTGLLN